MTRRNLLLAGTALALFISIPAFAMDGVGIGPAATVIETRPGVTTTTIIRHDTAPVATTTRTERVVTYSSDTPVSVDADAWVLDEDDYLLPNGYTVTTTTSGDIALVDINRDGLIGTNEFREAMHVTDDRLFDRIDADRNGRLSKSEIDNFNNTHSPNLAVTVPTKEVRTYRRVETSVDVR